MKEKITGSTMVPLSIIAIVAGGVFWLSTMFVTIQSATADIEALKRHLEEFRNLVLENQTSIDRRLSSLQGKVDYIHRYHAGDEEK